ncbi:MAG: hypothetical protein IJV59_07650 [Eubacterium sp.]|nr:hypothetical protein [Eubacterium sp.]MBQ9023458.1 hypothetical protein [Eubacterium sp.]
MSIKFLISIIIMAAIVVAFALVLYFLNKRASKRQDEQQAQIEQYKQQVNMLVIDKKKMKLKESGLPQEAIDGVPWYSRLFKVPIVKAKVGPRIMTFVADAQVFQVIPVKKEVKATISGLYITDVRGIRSQLEKPQKKKNFFRRLMGEK